MSTEMKNFLIFKIHNLKKYQIFCKIFISKLTKKKKTVILSICYFININFTIPFLCIINNLFFLEQFTTLQNAQFTLYHISLNILMSYTIKD